MRGHCAAAQRIQNHQLALLFSGLRVAIYGEAAAMKDLTNRLTGKFPTADVNALDVEAHDALAAMGLAISADA